MFNIWEQHYTKITSVCLKFKLQTASKNFPFHKIILLHWIENRKLFVGWFWLFTKLKTHYSSIKCLGMKFVWPSYEVRAPSGLYSQGEKFILEWSYVSQTIYFDILYIIGKVAMKPWQMKHQRIKIRIHQKLKYKEGQKWTL